MRRFHRWFGLITGVFFLFVSLTGIGMEAIKLVQGDAPKAVVKITGGAPVRAVAKPMDLYHWLNHIHDGELAGPVGRVVVLLLGVALFFFSVSGIWMYWTMFSSRQRLGKSQIFW